MMGRRIVNTLVVASLAALMTACSDELRDIELTGKTIGISTSTIVASSSRATERLFREGGLQVWGINTRQGTFVRGGDYRGEQFRVEHLFPARVSYNNGAWIYAPVAQWPVDDLLTLMAAAPADLSASGFEAMADYADTRRFAITFCGDALPTGPLLVASVVQRVYNRVDNDVKFTFMDMLSSMSFRINNELDADIDSLVAIGVTGQFPMAVEGSRPRVLLDEQAPQWENLSTGHLDYGHHYARRFDTTAIAHAASASTDYPLYFFPGFADDVKFEILYTLRDSVGVRRREAVLNRQLRLEQGKNYLFDITLVEHR